MNAHRPELPAARVRAGNSPNRLSMIAGMLIAIALFLPAIGRADDLLTAPQKIVIDRAHNRLLVSNDGTGDIIQIDSLGVQDTFALRAGFVDGMEIAGNTLYGVALPKRIKCYDLDTALPTDSIPFSGNGYLSSIVSDNAGHLYISCPNLNTIYKMRTSDMSYWVFASGYPALNKPNGMIYQEAENRLVVIEDRYHPRILAVSLADSTVRTLLTTSLSSGDGIATDMYGRYYVTGYYLDGMYRFDPSLSLPPNNIYPGNGIVYPTYDAVDNSMLTTLYDAHSWARVPIDVTGVQPAVRSKALWLHQNSPNPFGSGTTIGFGLSAGAHTRLDVYSVTGAQVKTLVDEERGPGSYAVTWNGTADSGQPVPGGVYYFSLKANGEEQTQKAILTR